jgi:hypothetical protein
LNDEAYTPQVISIGPFYHGDKRLETMEMVKVRYFKIFVRKARLNVENLVRTMKGIERDVCRCYGETSRLNSNNYVKMILLDTSFIIVFFLIGNHVEWMSDDDFKVFNLLLTNTVIDDINLLENQLPFYVIKELYNFAFASHSNNPSFTQLTFNFFTNYNTQKMSAGDPNLKVMHFVDLLRTHFFASITKAMSYKP